MPTEDEILRSLRPQVTQQQQTAVAAAARKARDLELEIKSLEERLKQLSSELRNVYRVELPELLDQAQQDRMGIPADGNMPAYDLKLVPFYSANIAASWPPERRNAAFEALTRLGHGDLIKTEVTLTIPREERAKVEQVLKALEAFGHPDVKQSVHFKTLTAWLKEQVEHGNELPPLDVIGAEIGRIVKLTERKA